MTANRHLADSCVHDLNTDPRLPYPDSTFDVVLCNLSIEYLTQPASVIRETARVLKPAGNLLISFSDRWFPPKATNPWQELHEFERLGYVIQLCWSSFDNPQTTTYRNWPRPVDDKHFPQISTSDPLYVVTGRAKPYNCNSTGEKQ